MPSSQISVFYPEYTSDTVKDKMLATVSLFETRMSLMHFNGGGVISSSIKYNMPSTVSGQGQFDASNFPYNNTSDPLIIIDTYNYGGFIGYRSLVNHFSSYHMGLVYNSYCSSWNGSVNNLCVSVGYVSGAPSVRDSAIDTSSMKIYIPGANQCLIGSTHDGYGNLADNNFKIYSYNGTDLSFMSLVNIDRCFAVTHARKLDDPTSVADVVISSGVNYTNEALNGTGILHPANVFNVFMNKSRVPTTYTSDILNYSSTSQKLILYKFVQDGYYFDNVYTYSGVLPSDHFYYNNEEYIRIAFNILFKLSWGVW